MTLSGQAFWRDQDRTMPIALPECPCCGRPYPVGRGVHEHALAAAEAVFGVSRAAIEGKSQTRQVARARALVVWALRSVGGELSYQSIGQLIGGRHHSTVVDAHQRAIAARLRDRTFARACDRIVFAVAAEKEAIDASN